MALSSAQTHHTTFTGVPALAIAAAMVAALFAGSTLLTPLYVMYKQQFGFSQITLTLIYAVYVVGNLAALLFFGRVSDKAGRRITSLSAMGIAIVSAIIFLFANNVASLYVARILSGLAVGIGAGTGTAWLAELIAEDDKGRATMIATSANFVGIAVGPLIAGLLAQYEPWPLRLPFIVYALTLLAVAVLTWPMPETISRPTHSLTEIPLRPKLSVPSEIRAQFVAPAVTGFGAMALVGFYAALAPSILAEHLHETSHAVAGALVFELAIMVSITIVTTQKLSSRAAMLSALVLMVPSVILVVVAQMVEEMTVMIFATALCGIAAGLGYRGSLQVINQIAPNERRAEVVSSYFVCGFTGNAIPVIGIGVIATLISPTIASMTFAGMIIVFAVVALGFGLKYGK